MFTDLNSLPDSSKVYIFPSERKFYENEFPEIFVRMNSFLEGFNNNLYFEIFYQRFIVIIVSDETPLSIEQNELLIEKIQDLETIYSISLLDKIKVFYKQGKFVQVKEVPDFKKLIKHKGVSVNTVVFNNFIHSKSEFECCWEVKAAESWISHLF